MATKLLPAFLATAALLILIGCPSVFVGFQGVSRQIESRRPYPAVALRAAGDVETDQPTASEETTSPFRLGSAALSLMAALVVTFWPLEEAFAARSGGRMGSMGGGMGRSMGSMGGARSAPRPPTARQSMGAPPSAVKPPPTVQNRTTVVNKTVYAPPPVVVAPVTPFGMGMGYGGFGMFGPPPSLGDVIVGNVVGNAISGAFRGPSGTDRMLEGQMRQDERQMDRQSAEIDSLKRQIEDLKNKPAGAPAAPAAAPGTVMIAVTVPEGKGPGQSLAVKAPNGPTYEVKVPDGIAAGQTFNVQLPSQS